MSNKTSYMGISGIALDTPYDFEDKKRMILDYIRYMLDRTQSMFEYAGLPDTIPARALELQIQTNGNTCVTQVNGDLYCMTGGLGGEPDPYYMPTIYTVANPALHYSANLKIDDDCIIIPNDSMYAGLLPMFSKYATMLADNDITMHLVDINARVIKLLTAGDDDAKRAAEKYLQDVAAGKMGVIAVNGFIESAGINAQDYAASAGGQQIFTSLIEYHQYLKASFWNDIGLDCNYNMKREAINSNESQLNKDALLPLIDDMLHQREQALDKINAMFGTSITVTLASTWASMKDEAMGEDAGMQEDEPKEDTPAEEESLEDAPAAEDEPAADPEDEEKEEKKNDDENDV